ncbi:pentatricopeptide repeat-containing protein At1g62260, mitochondrial [Magnolia sinica]|uniref:pentatricopeptide repeat-containing protein At1g62260, mitochondrial n=1 Tax=Magnolia sinica TaxID=86752 RepID=UPI00265954FA|nr:pentatricopeptide repeat-containing protein At1g62260, mitochondrial [Magnolia sinica]
MGAFTFSLFTYSRRAAQLEKKKISHQLTTGGQSSRSRSYSTIATQSKHPQQKITCSTDRDFRLRNKTISLLIRSGRLSEARRVFDEMLQRNVVTWNSMISGYVRQREISNARKLFDAMPERDIVSWNVMISGYVSCLGRGHIEEGRWLFDRMPERDTVSWNTMISGYARNGRMEDALNLFQRMPGRNVISWNAMISGFLQHGDISTAIEMFERMPTRDSASLSGLISGLIQNRKLEDAADVLLKIGRVDSAEDAVDAYNTLIAGYGQSGRVDEARQLFDQIPLPLYQERVKKRDLIQRFERNIVSWNSMIMCYVKAGNINSARELFDEMPERDLVSWNTMITGYVHASDLEEAASLFHEMPDPDSRSWNSMISGYAQKGELELARDFFEKMPQKSLVSWNSMIAGYEQNGDYEGAMGLFFQMQSDGGKPDKHTLSSVLSACSGLAALHLGMQIHQRISKTVIPDIPINNSLITMYSRCGNITDAKAIFDDMQMQRDVVSWNAMIGGYAQHGFAGEALDLFREMKTLKVRPTHITFISVLNACTHAGLVAEGRRQFDCMVHEFGISPRVEHFASLVDVIGRHGQLKDAVELIEGMPVAPDRAVWGALLGACRVHNNMDLAQIAAEALMIIEPESSAPYVLLHNMYVDADRWDDATEVRMMMERNKIRKQPGYSWIELHSKVHVFTAGDRTHPHADEIHTFVESFCRVMKDLDSESGLTFFVEGESEE